MGLLLACAAGPIACDGCGSAPRSAETAPSASAGATVLSPELASRVLATVGDRKITLGDYATALDRMDQFERLRYQTAERRRMLLDEMINIELLAREAERRGLDKKPETQAHVRQILRTELVRDLRAKQPQLDEVPLAEVREYYEDNKEEFFDPPRRRVAAFWTASRARAEAALVALKNADAKTWGAVFREYSAIRSKSPRPLEFEGDLGLVSEPGETRGTNAEVPVPVRAALFTLSKQGDIYPEPVEHQGRYYVVRLLGVNGARSRTLEEVESVIRARLLQQMLRKAEDDLDRELRKKIPVQVNQEALRRLRLPTGVMPEPGR